MQQFLLSFIFLLGLTQQPDYTVKTGERQFTTADTVNKPGVIYIINRNEGRYLNINGRFAVANEPYFLKFHRDSSWFRLDTKRYISIIVPPGSDTTLDLQIDHNMFSRRHKFVSLEAKSGDTVYYALSFNDMMLTEYIRFKKIKASAGKDQLERCLMQQQFVVGEDVFPVR
jgi:hypothetical protein